MDTKNLSFWLQTASELNDPDIWDRLAECIVITPDREMMRGIDLWCVHVHSRKQILAKNKNRHILSEKELNALLWWNEDE